MKAKTSTKLGALIWFGAAVSLAEIMTGSFFAPLGMAQGLLAVIIGHIIGCGLLFSAGLISARQQKNAMESTAFAYGQYGMRFFALLNVTQLVGWTAVMIAGGAFCANGLFAFGTSLWSIILGALIILWVLMGITNVSKINVITMSALFLLTLFASTVVFGNSPAVTPTTGSMSFGTALELSIAMPLSWLPLIGDYTRNAERPTRSTLISVLVYGITSSWMYAIGLGLALYAGGQDLAVFLASMGFGAIAIFIVLASTVTTTFLDAYSAGVSARCIFPMSERAIAVTVCIIGTIIAIVAPTGAYESFLYLIGSAFAPMITILIAEAFIFQRDAFRSPLCIRNAVLWVIGVALYRYFLTINTPIGNTLPVMAILFTLCLVVGAVQRKKVAC